MSPSDCTTPTSMIDEYTSHAPTPGGRVTGGAVEETVIVVLVEDVDDVDVSVPLVVGGAAIPGSSSEIRMNATAATAMTAMAINQSVGLRICRG